MPSVCSITDCGKIAVARRFCSKHYKRWKDHGDPLKTLYDVDGTRGCATAGCWGTYYAKGLCERCYQRLAHAARKVRGVRPPGRPLSVSTSPAAATASPCWAAGCAAPPAGQDGLCEEHRRLAEEWNADAEEVVATCRFNGCGETVDPGMFDCEVPCCPTHRQCVEYKILLEEVTGRGMFDAPWDSDWLGARWIAELRAHASAEDRPLYDRVVGDRPLFRPLLTAFDRLVPWMQEFARDNGRESSGCGPR